MNDEIIPSFSTKRRRISVVEPLNSHCKAVLGPYWFKDGDFVLRVENFTFKVHHDRLSCSEIFMDMLAIPQPINAESVDGCAFVELPDSPADWMVVLEWIYTPT